MTRYRCDACGGTLINRRGQTSAAMRRVHAVTCPGESALEVDSEERPIVDVYLPGDSACGGCYRRPDGTWQLALGCLLHVGAAT